MNLRYNFDSLEEYLTTGERVGSDGRIAEAVAVLREAAERYPESATAHYNLGTALLMAYNEDRQHNELWESLSDEEDLLEQVIVAFQNAIDRDPGMLSAYNNLARALALHGRHDDAGLVWERSLEMNPDQPEVRADYEMFRTQLSAPADELETRALVLEDTGLDAPPPEDRTTQSDIASQPDETNRD